MTEPLTADQETALRADLAADRWGSTPRWSSQSMLLVLATLDRERAEHADDPQFDGTDGAHPAWWRGCDYGYAKGRAEHAALREKARAVVTTATLYVEDPDSPECHLSSGPYCGAHSFLEYSDEVDALRIALDEVKG